MSPLNSAQVSDTHSLYSSGTKVRRPALGNEARVLTSIYLEETNIAIWQRQLSATLKQSVDAFLRSNPNFQLSMTVAPQSVLSSISESLGNNDQVELCENIAELTSMFCCLFELKRAGLRLTALDRAMCPKFHVDKVPCRLITTFQGAATEWLPHHAVNRQKLGIGSNGQPDDQSGLYQRHDDIQQLNCGDVGLLKGELWSGNESAGLVHRSPALEIGERRLLLTLDFSD